VSELDEFKAELLDTPKAQAEYRRTFLAMRLGEEIRQLREAAGLSQEELAGRIGTKQPGIARLERGSGLPTLDLLDRVATALGMDLHVGFGRSGRARVARPNKTAAEGSGRTVARVAGTTKVAAKPRSPGSAGIGKTSL
jgi:transcriptional regulator with XRE-family HTH domain